MPTASFEDVNLYYEVYGAGSPLVLAHGFTESSQMWKEQAQALSERYQVILYDARGHGLSTAPLGAAQYTLEAFVSDLLRMLDHLGIERAYVGGLSMGGATAAAFAARYPARTRAVIICAIDAGHQPMDEKTQAEMAAAMKETQEYVRQRGLADHARRSIALATAPPPVLRDPGLHQEYLERFARMSENGFLGVSAAQPWRAEWLRAASESIHAPAAIIAGGDDDLKVGARLLHESLPGSRFVLMEGAAHNVARWRPDAFNAALLAFLEKVERDEPVGGEIVV